MNRVFVNARIGFSKRRLIRRTSCPVLSLLTALALVLPSLRGATPDLPSADALLQRHIDAIGGSAALRQAQSLTFKGEVDLPFVKAKAPIEFLFQAPDRFYCEFRYHHAFFGFLKVPFVAKRKAECGYDGTGGWLVDFDSNVEPLYGMDEAFFRGLLGTYSSLCFQRSYLLTRTLDIERFSGRDCYRVLLVLPFGEQAFEFYDVATGLLSGTVYPFETDDAVVNIITTYSDLRPVGGNLRLPFKIGVSVSHEHYTIQASDVRISRTSTRPPASKLKSVPPTLPLLRPATMSAREVIDRHVAACGGSEALQKHTSLHLSGTYQRPGRYGFTNALEIFRAVSNRFLVTLPTRTGMYREGSDSACCWTADGANIRFARGVELQQKTAERNFYADLHAPESFRSMETLGTIAFEGHDCYQLLLIRTSGEVLDEFYDVQTGRLRARRTTDQRSGGTFQLTSTFDDYRRFDDWMLPMRQSFKLTGAPQVAIFTNAEWDAVPDAVFLMPADVKAAEGGKKAGGD
jgi:hypothetical protein